MADRAAGRGSGHGIDGAILETGVGGTGTVLETDTREARRRQPEVGNAASGAGAIEPRAAGAQEGFPRCRTSGEAAGSSGIDLELCARSRAAFVAGSDAHKIPPYVHPGPLAETTRSTAE